VERVSGGMEGGIGAEGFELWRLGKKAKAQSERPNCIFDLARMMVRFARGPDDCATSQRTSGAVACRLEYRRWPGDDQAKSLFNSSLRASLPARLAAAVVSK